MKVLASKKRKEILLKKDYLEIEQYIFQIIII